MKNINYFVESYYLVVLKLHIKTGIKAEHGTGFECVAEHFLFLTFLVDQI